MSRKHKLFILVRKDIPVADQVVQCSHVAVEWGRKYSYLAELEDDWDKTMVVVTVPNLVYLELWKRKLDLKTLTHSIFKEPDMRGEMTAIACLTDSNIFDSLPLWEGT